MKQSILYAEIALAICAGFIGNNAFAKPWWSSPVVKYSENTGVAYNLADPHYMNKDESDQYLFVPLSSGGGTVQLYSIPALIAATSSNDIAPIAQSVNASTAIWGSWKGCAVSDDLKIAITGNGNAGNSVRTTFPLSAPWTNNVTVFCSTNNPNNLAMDGCDFSHDSTHLYSDIYTSTGLNSNLVTWSVSYVPGKGIGLTQESVFMTSCTRFRCVNDYYIGGKDLLYYGEGNDLLGVKPRNAYVYDPALGTETLLVSLNRTNEVGKVGADLDIMNVKVGGVRSGKMHLYLQCNDGAIYIYNLASDGKTVGALVKSFHHADLQAIFGVDFPRIRNIEFTDDEEYGFIDHKPFNIAAGNALLHVLWTPEVATTAKAWFNYPYLKVKESVSASEPRCMNKDEADQFLFLPSGISSASSGYLYSIPALTAAKEASAVAPIISGKPSAFQPGTIIYHQDFDGITANDNDSTMAALGWQINTNLNKKNTASYSVHDGRIFVDNLSASSVDGYAVIKDSNEMKAYCTNDYSYQYDVTYREANTNNFRYFSLLCNYLEGSNYYNTVDVRIRGEGYNQSRRLGAWDHYSSDFSWPLEGTYTNSMMYLLHGLGYDPTKNGTGNAGDYYNMTNRTITVRVEMSVTNGASVYVNGMLVSKMDINKQNWAFLSTNAYAICFKTSTRLRCEVDNIMVWQGCGVEPVWKGGAISDQKMRVLTASAGAVNASLPLNGAWTKDATVFGITNVPEMVTANMDAMDFGHSFGATQYLYSYSDYFWGATNTPTPRGYQHKIYKWDVANLVSNGVGFASNAVYTTALQQLRNLDVYYIGGKDLVYYGEGQVGLAGAAKVCVLDTVTSNETVLVNATTNAMPSNVMNVKVSGVGLGQMYLYVQCDDGSLDIYELSADGLSVGNLVKTFTPAEIKTLLGGVSFTNMRSFEVTNDGKYAFFSFFGSDGLYVVETVARPKGTVLMIMQ